VGEGDWRVVERAGIPFAVSNLRDGSTYYAVKKGEAFQKTSNVRGFYQFTVNQVWSHHSFAVRYGNDIRHVWLAFVIPSRIREICEAAWGRGSLQAEQPMRNSSHQAVETYSKPLVGKKLLLGREGLRSYH
jgi:hypothetical protein